MSPSRFRFAFLLVAGVDAGVYARELMEKAQALLVTMAGDSSRDACDDDDGRHETYHKGSVDVKKVLLRAHANTTATGSTTAVIMALREQVLNGALSL